MKFLKEGLSMAFGLATGAGAAVLTGGIAVAIILTAARLPDGFWSGMAEFFIVAAGLGTTVVSGVAGGKLGYKKLRNALG
jgi:hypothetical protein